MNKEIKTQWLAALRSGEYQQGKGSLRGKNNEFCCLGVLCDIAVKNGVIPEPRLVKGSTVYQYGGIGELFETLHLPKTVQEWAELPNSNPRVESKTLFRGGTLAYLNDQGATFEQIADLIEECL